MQIVCPNCQTSYHVDPSSVGSSGRSVRCARCQTVWFAANTEAMSEIAASHRAEMAQFVGAGAEPDLAVEWPEPEAEVALGEPQGVGFVHDAPPIAGEPGLFDPSAAPDGPLAEAPALAPVEPEPA